MVDFLQLWRCIFWMWVKSTSWRCTWPRETCIFLLHVQQKVRIIQLKDVFFAIRKIIHVQVVRNALFVVRNAKKYTFWVVFFTSTVLDPCRKLYMFEVVFFDQKIHVWSSIFLTLKRAGGTQCASTYNSSTPTPAWTSLLGPCLYWDVETVLRPRSLNVWLRLSWPTVSDLVHT